MLFLFCCLRAVSASAGEPDFLAYGDIRGYLEPCGCDPATDLGGILRLNSQLKRERLNYPSVLVFNLGNNLSDKKRDSIKNRYLLSAEEKNHPTAFLVNELEILYAQQNPNKKVFDALKIPFLLSNGQTTEFGAAVIEAKQAVVFGYTWAKTVADKVKKVDQGLLQAWKKTLGTYKSSTSILLFSGSDEDLKKFVDAKLFTLIISANTKPLDKDPGKEEVDNEGLLVRSATPLIYMVPSGGQGLLRGGSLTRSEAKTVASIFNGPEKTCSGNITSVGGGNCAVTLPFVEKYVRFTWLRKDTESGHDLADLYKGYNEEVSSAFKESGKSRLLALKDSPFAGVAACAQCHPSQSAVYSQSKHAHAMQTLVDRNKHENPECVQCHAVGADSMGGFVSVLNSPHLANVQCENCHGPRKAHAANPTISSKVKLDKSVCLTCHNTQHSPNFDFAKYWESIKH